ncbi:Neuroligin-1 [Hypsibius exemplaris]|uniref:Neuroligin-1 n=1 Tax=Hypsibius exemplaris TaxID=2072580 RepID=A0A1W0X869_HYPEX|nr:Neuroligin-1 [Hypsibius exemplaris]
MLSSLTMIYLFLIVVSCKASSYTRPSTKVVSTKYGVIRGLMTQFSSDLRPQLQPVDSYLGIPYAASPTGNLRFMPPTTPSHFEGGVRNATSFGPVCPQISPNVTALEAEKNTPKSRLDYLKRLDVYLRNQSEDCLYLNIYVPSSSRDEKEALPVLVYVHGESYSWGSGNPYDGSVLASYGNMVVVTLNYRLGIFGFLSTGDGVRGNYGLMDQVAAIKFVEENIEQFGGDPNNITLLGHGTGAACVNLLMISPVAANLKPLFQRAILLSGSALSPWAISHDPRRYTSELAKAVKCPGLDVNNNINLIRCLRGKSVGELLKVQLNVPQFLTGFGPTIDGIFIPNHPRIVMRNYASLYRKYGLLIGLTRSEAVNHLTKKELAHGFDEQRQNRLLRTFVRNLFSFHLGEVFTSIKFEYADWEKTSRPLTSIRDSTLDVLGDALTVSPLLEAAQLHAGSVAQETFMYLFQHAHRSSGSEGDDYSATLDSVYGDDLPYIFGAPLLHQQPNRIAPWTGNFSQQDAYLSEVTANFISNFVRTGEPRRLSKKQSAVLSDAVRQAVTSNWPKFDADRQKYLQISARSKDVRDHYRAHKSAFWTELIPKLNVGGSSGSSSNIPKQHHELSDFDKLDSYDGVVRSMAFLSLPPPPLPPSITPPPWRDKTSRARATSSASSSTLGNDVVVTAVEPEAQINQSALNTGLIIGIAIGATLLIVNALVCVSVHYQRRKLRKKYPKTVRTPSMDKRNGVPQTEHAEHVETLLPVAASGGSHDPYSMPGTPLPASSAGGHYGHSHRSAGQERPTRTFNTFSDQHRFMTGSVTGSDNSMPVSLPPSTLLRVLPHLVSPHPLDVHGSGGATRKVDAIRKAGSVTSQLKLQQEETETDETAV